MAPPKQQKRWILAPTRDLPPSGPIALGAIVTSAKRADQPLHTPSLAGLPPSAITTHDAHDWTLDHQRTATGRVGLWTSFCQSLVGVGGDAGISWTTGARERWEVGVEVVGLVERDAGGDDLDLEEVEAVEEENGEECVCVRPED
ncbi:hypothetical protein UCDDS831_g01025 [Diplodia seriata]|uniref:Uncharacterized protein n=1 Tax=Diplodia seriata TaxID=420778 RepID=A0A0G2EY36_9PEZI|nr:hypothetical protein UCDDS831_g01025 [Diplodia seriata]